MHTLSHYYTDKDCERHKSTHIHFDIPPNARTYQKSPLLSQIYGGLNNYVSLNFSGNPLKPNLV